MLEHSDHPKKKRQHVKADFKAKIMKKLSEGQGFQSFCELEWA